MITEVGYVAGYILVSQWHFGRPYDVFLPLWVTLGLRFVILGAPLWHPGVPFVILGEHLGGFCGFGVTLGLHCGTLGLHLGTLGPLYLTFWKKV